MTSENCEKLVRNLKRFWHPGDEIICTRIFRRSHNNCYLCGNTPIEWHHVLLNSISNQTIDVEFSCVINLKKLLVELGSDQKLLFPKKYAEEAEHLNSLHEGTAEILEFNSNTDVIVQLLSKPNDLTYKQVKAIMDHTVKFTEGVETELFGVALDLYVDRKYYIYESIKEFESGDNVEKVIEDYLRNTSYEDITGDYCENLYECTDIAPVDHSSEDDLSPEGLGTDEIDWDSHDK